MWWLAKIENQVSGSIVSWLTNVTYQGFLLLMPYGYFGRNDMQTCGAEYQNLPYSILG
jgi:hypothetical protein